MPPSVPVFAPASPLARPITDLAWLTFGLGLAVFLLIAGLTFYFVWRFRFRGAPGEPPQIFGDNPEELTWMVAAGLILAVLFAASWWTQARADPQQGRSGLPDFTVTAHQWFWSASYPNGARVAGEIHIPTGRRLLVALDSADVIHDFWVPQLARKMDVIPGQQNRSWIQADTPGRYVGICSEFCGAEHAWMRFEVVAQKPADYQRWLQTQAQPAQLPTRGAAARGLVYYRGNGCGNCHSLRGVSGSAGEVGPDLTHLASRDLLAGGVLSNSAGNLSRWLHDPDAVKPGTRMPRYPYTETQLKNLIAFLGGLK